MSTAVRPDVDLEELLDAEIPCGGIITGPVKRTCDKGATLAWANPHNCSIERGADEVRGFLKCADCWMTLYQHLADIVAHRGQLRCGHCGGWYRSVLAFTDYRPF